jgi:hypothetical protein
MNSIDNVMTDFLIGLYLGLTTLLMINIFIALLTTTFNRVYDKSRAYFLLQRAIEILNFEHCKKIFLYLIIEIIMITCSDHVYEIENFIDQCFLKI